MFDQNLEVGHEPPDNSWQFLKVDGTSFHMKKWSHNVLETQRMYQAAFFRLTKR